MTDAGRNDILFLTYGGQRRFWPTQSGVKAMALNRYQLLLGRMKIVIRGVT
ncbi:MAG: hypothetical protein V1789_11310 [PVC group bacterium]